jgi:hypothetical protein
MRDSRTQKARSAGVNRSRFSTTLQDADLVPESQVLQLQGRAAFQRRGDSGDQGQS